MLVWRAAPDPWFQQRHAFQVLVLFRFNKPSVLFYVQALFRTNPLGKIGDSIAVIYLIPQHFLEVKKMSTTSFILHQGKPLSTPLEIDHYVYSVCPANVRSTSTAYKALMVFV